MKLYHELAEYYFAIEEQHREMKDEIAFIRSLFGIHALPDLLDLGCGTGEHLAQLSRFGITTTGIDNSQEMVRLAQDRFPDRVRFIHEDMRTIDFYEEFELVISLYGTFDYLLTDEDINKTLWNCYRALKPGGRGIFEIWNAYPIEQIKSKDLSLVSTSSYGDATIRRERGFKLIPSQNGKLVEVNFSYLITDSSGKQQLDDRHIMRVFDLDEISGFFNENGFSVKNVYSSYLKEPFTPMSSKMICLVERQNAKE